MPRLLALRSRPVTVRAQSMGPGDVDARLLVRTVACFATHTGSRPLALRRALSRVVGVPLRLSRKDRRPAGDEVLRRFDAGPADDERLP